jgi:hypothetical protein
LTQQLSNQIATGPHNSSPLIWTNLARVDLVLCEQFNDLREDWAQMVVLKVRANMSQASMQIKSRKQTPQAAGGSSTRTNLFAEIKTAHALGCHDGEVTKIL